MVDEVVRGAAPARGAGGRTRRPRRGASRRATGAATAATRSTSACSSWPWALPSRPGLAVDRTVTLAPGESATIGGYASPTSASWSSRWPTIPRVIETRAEVARRAAVGLARPALRDYSGSPTAIATPAVRTSLAEDLYVTLLASDTATGAVTLHLFVNPLVVWIWIGGAIVGLGAAFAIWPERRAHPRCRGAAAGRPSCRRRAPDARLAALAPGPDRRGAHRAAPPERVRPRPAGDRLAADRPPAPDWSLTTLDGETLELADLAGRPYVVNFWASWCGPPCVDEHPV